jgi:hypothetical protein
MDHKTFLSMKRCVFNNFFNFFKIIYIRLTVNFSQKFNMTDFLHQNSLFFWCMFIMFIMLYLALKFKMDVKTFLSFKTCVFKYFFKFLQDCLNLELFIFFKIIFFLKIQNGRKNQNDRFFAQISYKYSWFFGSGTARWNVLIFGYVILLTLVYCKKIDASRERSKWRLYSRWRWKWNFSTPIFLQ